MSDAVVNEYETNELLGQYLAFHFGEDYFGESNYPARCAALCRELTAAGPQGSALDLGCAVGRSSFELAKSFDTVTGLDLSTSFIDNAKLLQERGELEYFLRDQGELGSTAKARLSDFGLEKLSQKVSFAVADACNLAENYSGYDLIFAGNLIDRLRDPKTFLASIHNHLAVNGVLVISSPYTLMEKYTPRENWIGGYYENHQPMTVLDGMRSILEPHFELMQEPIDLPFVIRETQRKFQHTIAEATAWQRIA